MAIQQILLAKQIQGTCSQEKLYPEEGLKYPPPWIPRGGIQQKKI